MNDQAVGAIAIISAAVVLVVLILAIAFASDDRIKCGPTQEPGPVEVYETVVWYACVEKERP